MLLPSGSATTQTYEDMLDIIDQKGIPTSFPKIGYTGQLGEADYQVVGPKVEDSDNQNDNSLMIRFQYGNASFLFTGDAEATEEADTMATGYEIQADVLEVGHHGSDTSTSQRFLQAVNPVCAVISCGTGNDYGHPHQETLGKLSEAGVTVYRTDLSGTITMVTDGAAIRVFVDGKEQQSFPAGQNASGAVRRFFQHLRFGIPAPIHCLYRQCEFQGVPSGKLLQSSCRGQSSKFCQPGGSGECRVHPLR